MATLLWPSFIWGDSLESVQIPIPKAWELSATGSVLQIGNQSRSSDHGGNVQRASLNVTTNLSASKDLRIAKDLYTAELQYRTRRYFCALRGLFRGQTRVNST